MYIWSTIRYQYIWKMLLTYQYFLFESVHGEAMLKMGWVVKKWNFSFRTATNWSKCILMVSLYTWLWIYTNNEILCIIWKFDFSSRGVLGRIYALSIEVLYTETFVIVIEWVWNVYIFGWFVVYVLSFFFCFSPQNGNFFMGKKERI